MDFTKFLHKPFQQFGDVITWIASDLYKEYNYENILFVRTCTTGGWLDKLLINNPNVTRILYYTDKIKERTTSHASTTIIHYNELEHVLSSLNKKFDLICMDAWHEYNLSLRDFTILVSFLNDTGMLISHDCFPWNKTVANREFITGSWCGETYLSFTEFAYMHPELYYLILKTDTGIGFISKKEMHPLSNKLDRKKQENFLLLHRNRKDYYSYFMNHSRDIINAL